MRPGVVRRLILPLHERILRRRTLHELRELERSQWWTLDRLRDHQARKLRALLQHAHDHCPFYRKRIDEAGLDPGRTSARSLRHLPTLSKETIAENRDAMVDAGVPGGLYAYTTGGSTGAPLSFLVDRRRQAADQAARARTRRWFGIDLGERELYLWGSPVEHSTQDRLKTLRDRLTNHRLLNAFQMTPAAMTRYLHEIARFDPVHVFGYPSSLARLFRHARSIGWNQPLTSLRAVFVTGEVFHPSDRAVIEEAVSVPVADGYGSREAGFIAHQCPSGSYHVTMESVIVELLDDGGSPVNDGRAGEITITHLDAFGMPFIRYRTGDIACRIVETCACGRRLECLGRIEGRRTDMLRTTHGGYAHALSVIYVLREEPAVAQFKVVQRRDLDLDVSIVPRGELEGTRRDRIRAVLSQQMGGGIEVRLSLVDRIPPDPSGKHRYVVSEA